MKFLLRSVVILIVFLLESIDGRPNYGRSINFHVGSGDTGGPFRSIESNIATSNAIHARPKRVSDQVLAEIETLYALSKVNRQQNDISTTMAPNFVKQRSVQRRRRERYVVDANLQRQISPNIYQHKEETSNGTIFIS